MEVGGLYAEGGGGGGGGAGGLYAPGQIQQQVAQPLDAGALVGGYPVAVQQQGALAVAPGQQALPPAQQLQVQRATSSSIATFGAKEFVKNTFYTLYDTKRENLSFLYRDNSVLTWCGQLVRGGQELITFVRSLPPSRHFVDSYDCQAINTSSGALLLTVTGSVEWLATGEAENVKGQNFMHTFVLAQGVDPNEGTKKAHYIAEENFRIVEGQQA